MLAGRLTPARAGGNRQEVAQRTAKPLRCAAQGGANPLQVLQSAADAWSRRGAIARAKQALRQCVAGTARGVSSGSGTRAAVEALVDQLAAFSRAEVAAGGVAPTDAGVLTGCWRLLWTSERETLWLLENGLPFTGCAAGESYQSIDVQKGTLSNAVLFGAEDSYAFVVTARAQVESQTRTRFAFSAAEVRRPAAKPLNIPPFGSGWFDTLYADAELRVARDSRGDTLLVERCRTPRRLD